MIRIWSALVKQARASFSAAMAYTDGANRARKFVWSVTILSSAISLFFATRASPFPYADEWQFASLAGNAPVSELWEWVWNPHVDHVIPLQKGIQLFLLNVSGFDFRILTLFNFILALGSTVLILSSLARSRSHSKMADAIVPLILLSPSWNFLSWGFQFQFIVTIFLTSLVIYLATKSSLREQPILRLAPTLLVIFTLSLTGINGSIASIILSLSIAWSIAKNRKGVKQFELKLLGIVLLGAVPNTLIWSTWKPTSASGQSQGPLELAEKFFFLFGSSFNIAGFSDRWLISLLVASLASVAAVVIVNGRTWSYQDRNERPFAAGLFVSLILLAAIAGGRGGNYSDWSNVISMHYGVLTVLIPIFSWGLISLSRDAALRISVACILLITSAFSYAVNVTWKISTQLVVDVQIDRAKSDIASATDSLQVAERHGALLSWRLDEENRQMIKTGLDKLRSANLALYPADAQE